MHQGCDHAAKTNIELFGKMLGDAALEKSKAVTGLVLLSSSMLQVPLDCAGSH